MRTADGWRRVRLGSLLAVGLLLLSPGLHGAQTVIDTIPVGSGGTGGTGSPTCTTIKPAANWVCVGTNWLPPGFPLPRGGTVGGGSGASTTGGSSGGTGGAGSPACTTIKPAANWVCVGTNWLPPGFPLQGGGTVGGGSGVSANPVPFIGQPLRPDAVRPGGQAFALTVDGTGFVPGAVVRWNGSGRATSFVSSSRLTATILASDILSPKTVHVTVFNLSPGGGESNGALLEVTPLSPSMALAKPSFFTVNGDTPTSIAVADFNRDGKPDMAVANEGSDNISILSGKGDGTFNASVSYSVGGASQSVAVGDFDSDGNVDLAVADSGSGNVSMLEGNGDGHLQDSGALRYRVGALFAGDRRLQPRRKT